MILRLLALAKRVRMDPAPIGFARWLRAFKIA
jgi:hypothetical protein